MPEPKAASVSRVACGSARLYVRDVGAGPPVVVVHGGPDFGHDYLLPELDLLADACRLVYYDQRGRGRSYAGDATDDVTMAGEVDDLDCVRRSLGLETMAVLGHSWGCLVAMEYALRFPERVSHLILLGAAPASGEAARTLGRSLRAARTADESATMAGLEADAAYQAGDLEADAAWYRIHFKPALQRPELLDDLVARLRRGSSAEGIVVARVIEQRLYDETWRARRLRPAGAAPAVARPDPAAPRRRRLHPGRAGASGGRRDPRLPPGAARRLRPLPIP